MRFHRYVYRIAFSLLILMCSGATQAADVRARISLVQLLATPGQYDGRTIEVVGYFVFEEENHTLYLSPDDAQYGVSNGGIEVGSFSPDISDYKRLVQFDRKYVRLRGVFHARAGSEWPVKKMMGLSVLAITDVEGIKAVQVGCPPACR
jgi:hypothetical protein